MIRSFLYVIVLLALIPLGSSGKIRPRVQRHIAALRAESALKSEAVDSTGTIILVRPLQDSMRLNRQRIKEVARAKPQAKPEKIVRRPVTRPADPGNTNRPPARPAVGAGRTRPPQAAPPPRRR